MTPLQNFIFLFKRNSFISKLCTRSITTLAPCPNQAQCNKSSARSNCVFTLNVKFSHSGKFSPGRQSIRTVLLTTNLKTKGLLPLQAICWSKAIHHHSFSITVWATWATETVLDAAGYYGRAGNHLDSLLLFAWHLISSQCKYWLLILDNKIHF